MRGIPPSVIKILTMSRCSNINRSWGSTGSSRISIVVVTGAEDVVVGMVTVVVVALEQTFW
jgi:hypothetical protein